MKPGFVEVVHFDEVRDFNFSSSEAYLVQGLIEEVVNQKQERGAVLIAKNDFQFGMARMLGSILEDYLPVSIVRAAHESISEIINLHGNESAL